MLGPPNLRAGQSEFTSMFSKPTNQNQNQTNTMKISKDGYVLKDVKAGPLRAVIEDKRLPIQSPHAALELPPLPRKLSRAITGFFYHVLEELNSEALVWCFHKDGEWLAFAPHQEVDGHSVHAPNTHMIDEYQAMGWQPIMSIHSHHSMKASFSVQDIEDLKDDCHFMVHGVMGELNKGVDMSLDFRAKVTVIPSDENGKLSGRPEFHMVEMDIESILDCPGDITMPWSLRSRLIAWECLRPEGFPEEWELNVFKAMRHPAPKNGPITYKNGVVRH